MKRIDEMELVRDIISELGLDREKTDSLVKAYEDYYYGDDSTETPKDKVDNKKSNVNEDTEYTTKVTTPEKPLTKEEFEDVPENSTTSKCYMLTDDVEVVDPECNSMFDLRMHANGAILKIDPVCITFDTVHKGMCIPGITNKQLLWVLFARYQKDPDKLKLVKELLAKELN